MKVRFIVGAMASLFLTSIVQAAEIKLLASAALKDAYLELIPQFERATGHTVTAPCSSTPDV
jgi:molybdate transport system substrate-binding protein